MGGSPKGGRLAAADQNRLGWLVGLVFCNLIDKLTIYYGLAIRRNSNSVENMKKAIMASFLHMISTDQKPQHHWCPPGSDSWCSWQQAKATNTLNSYHYKPALHPDVAKVIEPIFRDLSSDNLLQRCVGGYTQNSNESFNNVVWRIAPKVSHSGSNIVNIAANIATCTFNSGTKSYLQVMDTLGIKVGKNADRYCEVEDVERIRIGEIKAHNATREGRIQRRQSRIAAEDAATAAEGLLYGPGIAD
ncbi:uncharacterized protein [Temnothorax nylanderi]|uniref:uncharacterized protein n=1 Tax=Temnothorax nylanderi TaxID=102681 RepID=UPI003A894247